MTDAGSPLDRLRAIERRRHRATVLTTALVVAAGLALFASFAVGHALGPTAMRPLEHLIGLGAALLLAVAVARPLATRRRDRGARSKWRGLREGRQNRTVVVYDDHVVIDDEVVLARTVERAERRDGQLLLRYLDPVAAGPLIRELEGPARALDAIADALTAR
mgnify:FL=1